jgi:hypothetical protein
MCIASQLVPGSGEGRKPYNGSIMERKRIANPGAQAAEHAVTVSHRVLDVQGFSIPLER